MNEMLNQRNAQPGLIMAPGPKGAWDSQNISSPHVILKQDGLWEMWYYGRDPEFDRMIQLPSGRCGMAISDDGIVWERLMGPITLGAVFEPSPIDAGRFDSGHVGVSDIYREDNLYWMWYFGGDQTVVELPTFAGKMEVKGFNMRPGCAVSRDGLNWVRLDGPYRGAFLDIGGPEDWDGFFCSWPKVLKHADGSYLMYYHTFNPAKGCFSIGLAISEDGFRWQKTGQILGPGKPGDFDEMGPSCRDVIRTNGQYLMFYEALNHQAEYCIGLAVSDNGIEWRKDDYGPQPGGPIFSHAPKGSGRWDAKAVGTPNIVAMPDDSFRMYYVGIGEGARDELSAKNRIGLALSDGRDFRKWHRWGE